jgi:hypothetical protein
MRVQCVSENGVFNMVTNTSEQDEGLNRDRQNIADLQNGGHKFILDGKTLQLPGVTPSDSRSSM